MHDETEILYTLRQFVLGTLLLAVEGESLNYSYL